MFEQPSQYFIGRISIIKVKWLHFVCGKSQESLKKRERKIVDCRISQACCHRTFSSAFPPSRFSFYQTEGLKLIHLAQDDAMTENQEDDSSSLQSTRFFFLCFFFQFSLWSLGNTHAHSFHLLFLASKNPFAFQSHVKYWTAETSSKRWRLILPLWQWHTSAHCIVWQESSRTGAMAWPCTR